MEPAVVHMPEDASVNSLGGLHIDNYDKVIFARTKNKPSLFCLHQHLHGYSVMGGAMGEERTVMGGAMGEEGTV